MAIIRLRRRIVIGLLCFSAAAGIPLLVWRLPKMYRLTTVIAAMRQQGAEVDFEGDQPGLWQWVFSDPEILVGCYGDSTSYDLSPLDDVPNVTWLRAAPSQAYLLDACAKTGPRLAWHSGRSFAALPNLEYLSLDGVRVAESGFSGLDQLQHLKWVFLTRISVSDVMMAHIGQNQSVEDLVIVECGLRDEQIALLRRCLALERLWLINNSITGEGLGALSRLPRLESLRLREPKLKPDEAFRQLQQLHHLRHLDVSMPTVDAATLRSLAALPALTSLTLADSAITEDAMASIALLPTLEQLALWNTCVSDTTIVKLRAIRPTLKVTIEDNRIPQE